MGQTSNDDMEMGVEQNKAPDIVMEETETASKEEFETGISVSEDPSETPVPGGVDPDVVTPREDQNTSEADLDRKDIEDPVSEIPPAPSS